MLRELYWKILPYDWRPGRVWYRIKCFCWHRYTTVKSRYLDHTWHDRCAILPETMFEILSQFIERECEPEERIEWYGEYSHKIGDKYVRDEMQELYDWWHQVYNKLYPGLCDRLWERAFKHSPIRDWVDIGNDYTEYKPEWATEKDEQIYKLYLDEIKELEGRMNQELKDNLHRIIEIMPYLWT